MSLTNTDPHKIAYFAKFPWPRVSSPSLDFSLSTDERTRVVLEQEARNNTASYDALEAAFELDPEAIYFLSDGAPRGGKIDAPGEIVSSLSGFNRVRRVSIHSIGIDTKSDTSVNPFARFMKALADANWGIYKAVD